MLTRLIAVLIVLLAPVVTLAGDRKKEVRFFDVGAIVRNHEAMPFVPLGPIDEPFVDPWCGEDDVTSFLKAPVLVKLVDGAGLFGNGHEIWCDAEQLGVRADAEDLPGVARFVAELWREASRRVEVRIRLVELPVDAATKLLADPAFAGLASGSLDAGPAAALVERARSVGRVRDVNTVSRPARRSSVGQVRKRSYVKDMGVEIAGGTEVGDPRVAWLRTGYQVDVRPHLLAGGGVFLEVMLQTSALIAEPRIVDLEADELGAVSLPACTRRTLFSAGRVAPGQAMALRLSTVETVRFLLLEPRVTGRPVERFLPTSALTGEQTGYSMAWSPDDDEGEDRRIEIDPELSALAPPRLQIWHSSNRWSFLEDLLGSVAAKLGQGGDGRWMEAGHGVLMPEDPAVVAGAPKVVAAREAAVLRALPVHVVVQVGGKETVSARLLTVPGRPVCFSAGDLRSHVADWEVEVASEDARIGDPEIRWAWGGVALNLRLDAGPVDGVVAARITGEVAELEDGFQTIRTGNAVTGIIESPRGRTVMVDADTVLTVGRPTVLRPADDVTVEITVEP